MNCELCTGPGGAVLWRDALCRVVSVEERGYAGYCRVIWNAHIKEMTDLSAVERSRLLETVLAVETVLRVLLNPDKINLASLGNLTPHLHWHVVPRFSDDPHFPQSIWGIRQRDVVHEKAANLEQRIARALETTLVFCPTSE